MTPDDPKPETGALTRRDLRERTDSAETPVQPDPLAAATVSPPEPVPEITDLAALIDPDDDVDSPAAWADPDRPATALAWIDSTEVALATQPASLDAPQEEGTTPPLFADARLRPSILRPRILVPLCTAATLMIAYSAATLLWPLHEVPPTLEAVEVTTTPADAATLVWPAEGSAGVAVGGVSSATSTVDAASMASITKVVTSMMVLDRMPLQLGEQGPEFSFTYGDNIDYWDYRRADQSALDVPVDGVLTEYQLLQGTLMGSANNYVDRLAQDIWGSDDQFATAAAAWLADRGFTGITVVTPSGFDEGNIATPEALLKLAERAMQNPVIAEIVGTPVVELPGAGVVTNTNGLLADPGVVGVKTGTLVGWSLLSAKDVTVGDTAVRLYAAVLNQQDDAQRLAASRSLYAEVEAALQDQRPAVDRGTVVGEVQTPWGTSVDVVSDTDATVVLWNGASATADVQFDLRDHREEGNDVGTLTVTGPVNAVAIDVSLAEEIAGPSPWWRLTHPLDLFGVNRSIAR